MNLMGMSFRDFVWRENPVGLHVAEERMLIETALPASDTGLSDLGRKRRRVKGEGFFTGEDCMERWEALRALFLEGTPGLLRLPGMDPFPAVPESLELVGAAGKQLLNYRFSFVEKPRGRPACSTVYPAAEGESLWDYALRYGKTLPEMVRANPDIRDIAALEEGQEVRVP